MFLKSPWWSKNVVVYLPNCIIELLFKTKKVWLVLYIVVELHHILTSITEMRQLRSKCELTIMNLYFKACIFLSVEKSHKRLTGRQ